MKFLKYQLLPAFFILLLFGSNSCITPKQNNVNTTKQEYLQKFATMTPAEIRAFEIDVMRKVADLALIPPKINTSPGPEYNYDQLEYGMTPWIERTPKGRLWCAWIAGEDGPKAFLLAATSDDNGKTWSQPCLVIDHHSDFLPMDRSTCIGSLWTDPTGKLWLFFDQVINYADGRHGVWAAQCVNPDAEKPEWSAPRRIWHGVMLNKPIVLATGEWVLAISLLQYRTDGMKVDAVDGSAVTAYAGPCSDYQIDSRCPIPASWGIFPELDAYRGVNVIISTDQGNTWEWRGIVSFPDPDWHEPMIVEKKDGTLWMLARVRNGIMETYSKDKGITWSIPSIPSVIRHPQSRFHLRRLASGRILLVKHGATIDTHEGRSKLSAWLSEDDGLTWKGGLMLDERNAVSYPDATQAPDGTLYIVHDRERIKLGEIILDKVTEEDILAGKLVSPGSEMKKVIIRPLKNR